MHDIHLVLAKLNDYTNSKQLTTEQLQVLFSEPQQNFDYYVLINELTEISTECRQTRESTVFDNTHDSWEYFAKITSIPHLISLFTGLLELSEKNPENFLYRRVALTTCRAYILLLTSPGAKIFDAFDKSLLKKVYKKFQYLQQLEQFREHEQVQIQMALIIILEDFQLYLKHVSFEEYEDLQVEFIDAVAGVMDYHHENGFLNKYSSQIQELCYTTLDNVCLPLHSTDVSSSMALVLNGTARLTKYTKPCTGGGTGMKQTYPLITDWFIEMLKRYPRQTCKTLNCYIHAILTNSDLTENRDDLIRCLDICAQYDAAMVRVCGESIDEFLEKLALSKESQHRCNGVELIGRMLMMNTKCEWKLFRSELPKTPREIKLMKMLLQKFYDLNNIVSQKAMNAFIKIANDGSEMSKEIIKKCFVERPRRIAEATAQRIADSDDDLDEAITQRNIARTPSIATDAQKDNGQKDNVQEDNGQNDDSEEDDYDYTKSSEYEALTIEIDKNLLLAIKVQLKNTSALVRRVVLLVLEFIASTNLNMDGLLLSNDFRQMYIDQSPLVRRQLVLSLDQIINVRQTDQSATTAYTKIILDLANDTDQKVMEAVMDSFKRNIFDKIQEYEKSSSLAHIFPWRLLKCMLNNDDSPDFRLSVQKWMNKSLLNAKTLSKIETHLDTSNATEAWILLAMVAPNVQGHSPERISILLLESLKYDMVNNVENCYIQLEVLSYWITYLSNPSKNEINRLLTEMLTLGSIRPRHINRTFGICYKLSCESGERDRLKFINEIKEASENYILEHKNSLFVPNLCDDRLINYIYLYSEVGVLLKTFNKSITNQLFVFLRTISDTQFLTIRKDSMLVDKINCVQSILAGFSTFNHEICGFFVPYLGKILRSIDHIKVSLTSIKCLGYLCKKNSAVVEAVVPYILMKTQHRSPSIREFAFQTLVTLILEDFLKFRGTLLVYVFAGILDPQREVKELTTELIMKYTLEKSDIFLRTCLLECPFVFNGCPCFGQTASSVSSSANILKGPVKQAAREFIYRFMIRKVEPVFLYMYFGNITRLLEHIEKDRDLDKSKDKLASIADFLYVCTEICIANEKQKKNVAKIVKETHNADGELLNDSEQPLSAAANENGETENAPAEETGKGRKGGKKNTPTIAQSLVTVEKIIPTIAVIAEKLRSINDSFGPIIDKLCLQICYHFDTLLEYAQPRKFWSKYQNKTKKGCARLEHSKRVAGSPPPSTSKRRRRSGDNREDDSGRCTVDDSDDSDDSELNSRVSRASTRSNISRAVKRVLKSPSSGQGEDEDTTPEVSSDSDSDNVPLSSTKSRKSVAKR